MNTPNMTAEQAKELKNLRKQEAAAVKAADKTEKNLRAQITRIEKSATSALAKACREHQAKTRGINRAAAKQARPLSRMLLKVLEGRTPENGALNSIRHRIQVLEGRLTS